jgi:hypothetical protein
MKLLTDIITYTNNSPDNMSFVWMNVDQNLFKDDSRGNACALTEVEMVSRTIFLRS